MDLRPVRSPGARPSRRRWLPVVALGAVALLLIVAGALLLLTPASPSVRVSALALASRDHACGIRNQSLAGFVAVPDATVHEVLTVTNPNASASCAIVALSVSTPGFRLTSMDLPLSLGPAQHGELVFDLLVPNGAFAGAVDLDLE